MKNWEEKMFDYIEGKLPETERHAFEQAISNDPALKQELELIKRLDRQMDKHRVLGLLGDEFSEKVIATLEARKSRYRSSNRILWLAVSLFSLVLVLAVLALPVLQSDAGGSLLPEGWGIELPAWDGSRITETLNNPALLQLALIINAIALLLLLDRILSNGHKIAFRE